MMAFIRNGILMIAVLQLPAAAVLADSITDLEQKIRDAKVFVDGSGKDIRNVFDGGIYYSDDPVDNKTYAVDFDQFAPYFGGKQYVFFELEPRAGKPVSNRLNWDATFRQLYDPLIKSDSDVFPAAWNMVVVANTLLKLIVQRLNEHAGKTPAEKLILFRNVERFLSEVVTPGLAGQITRLSNSLIVMPSKRALRPPLVAVVEKLGDAFKRVVNNYQALGKVSPKPGAAAPKAKGTELYWQL